MCMPKAHAQGIKVDDFHAHKKWHKRILECHNLWDDLEDDIDDN